MKRADFDNILKSVSDMSMKELTDLRTAVDTRTDAVKAEEVDKVNTKIRETIEASGFNADEFLKNRGQIGPRNPKFRDPANPSNVWGGRGKKPGWLQDKLAEGKSLDSFKVVQTASAKAA